MNIETVLVEIAKLEIEQGDCLLLTPKRKLSEQERQHLHEFANHIGESVRVKCIVGDKDLEFSVIKKMDAA